MITEQLVAKIPKDFSDIFLSAEIYPLKPTFPKGASSPFLQHLDTAAILRLESNLYDTDWCNWDETTYHQKFEITAAYGFNPFRDGIPTALNPENLPGLYQKFVAHFLKALSDNLGQAVIEKKPKRPSDVRCFFFEDSGHYMETSHKFEEEHTFMLFTEFSKIVTTASGNRRARLRDETCSVHKTGTRLTMDQLQQIFKDIFDNAYQIVVEKRFNECLAGK